MAYRSDADALLQQCDSLRRELEQNRSDAKKLAHLERELADKTKALAKLEARLDPNREKSRTPLVLLSLVLMGAGAAAYLMDTTDRPTTSTSATWFTTARGHCNSLDAREFLQRSRPPKDSDAAGYVAACWALAGNIDEARRAIVNAGSGRSRALVVVFDIAHPIADTGDDRSAGPIMDLVVELWPTNYQAMYHAGMSDYATGNIPRATSRLQAFLEMYPARDHLGDRWATGAKQALAGIRASRSFAEAFGTGQDPRIE